MALQGWLTPDVERLWPLDDSWSVSEVWPSNLVGFCASGNWLLPSGRLWQQQELAGLNCCVLRVGIIDTYQEWKHDQQSDDIIIIRNRELQQNIDTVSCAPRKKNKYCWNLEESKVSETPGRRGKTKAIGSRSFYFLPLLGILGGLYPLGSCMGGKGGSAAYLSISPSLTYPKRGDTFFFAAP